jgi:hypothetical protein
MDIIVLVFVCEKDEIETRNKVDITTDFKKLKVYSFKDTIPQSKLNICPEIDLETSERR